MGLNTVYHKNEGQTSLMQQMQGLEFAKQVEFCLFKIGEIGELAKAPKVGDYWKAFALHEPAAVQMEELARRLAAEVEALERMGTMGEHGLTIRGKLWIYQLAIDCLQKPELHDPAELARLCTWADFRRLFAAEVAALCDEDTRWQAELAEKRKGAPAEALRTQRFRGEEEQSRSGARSEPRGEI